MNQANADLLAMLRAVPTPPGWLCFALAFLAVILAFEAMKWADNKQQRARVALAGMLCLWALGLIYVVDLGARLLP